MQEVEWSQSQRRRENGKQNADLNHGVRTFLRSDEGKEVNSNQRNTCRVTFRFTPISLKERADLAVFLC